MKKKLRIAIITEDVLIPAWHYELVFKLKSSFLFDTVLRIEAKIPPNTTINHKSQPWLWKLYKNLDKKIFNVKPDANQLVDARKLFTTSITCQFCRKEDVEQIKAKELDVILNLTNLTPPKPLAALSKHGIWYFIHSDASQNLKTPIAIWELLNKKPEIGAMLCCEKKDHQEPIILAKTFACTDRLSLSRNENAILWQTFPLAIKALRNLYLQGDKAFFENALQTHANSAVNLEPVTVCYPSKRKLINHLFSTAFLKIIQLVKSRFYFNQWSLLFYVSETNTPELNLTKFKRIIPPKDRFWADPFLYKKNGRYYLFIEELVYKKKLGELAVMEIDEQGNYTKPKTILSKNYHLSYPFLFEEDGVLFMIPETSNNKDIQLYVCTDFPLKWELVTTLMNNVEAVDTTIHKQDGLYWMFTNIRQHKGGSKHSELFLFTSDELASSHWKPHPNNPIISDVKQSRPAGNLFTHNGKLIRPAQNCSHYYGYGMNFCEIESLNTCEYRQQIIQTLNPKWKKEILATHTFNYLDKISISDALIKRKRYF
jgi:hypothetical protein